MSRPCALSAVQGHDWLLQAVDVLGKQVGIIRGPGKREGSLGWKGEEGCSREI